MSLYLCLPAPTLQGSSEEYRVKNVKGLKCPPSQSPVIIQNPIFTPALSDLNSHRYLRVCSPKAGEAKARPHEYTIAETGKLPDLPLPLPKIVFASVTALSGEKLKELKARKYLAGRTKYKHVYTITVPTTIEVLKDLKKVKLEDDYVAPSGFCTPKSAQAFIVIRKLVSASLATLFEAPVASRIHPRLAKDYPTHSVVDVNVQEMAVEGAETGISVISVDKFGSLQGISPNQIPNKASWGYFYLPYFRGMIGSDKTVIRQALMDMAPALDLDQVKAVQIINSLISVAEKPLEGEHGRVVAHLAATSLLAKRAGLIGYSICPGKEYVGTVLCGSKNVIASDAYGEVKIAGSYEEVHDLVSAASTSLAAKERLLSLICDLEIDKAWEDDENSEIERNEVEKLSSSYAIYYLLNSRSESFAASENNSKIVLECMSYLDVSQDVRREFTSEGLQDFISWMINDEVPYSLDEGRTRYFNIPASGLTFDMWVDAQCVFGGVAFSPVWPGGKRYNLPAPGGPDKFTKPREVLVKKGDRLEKTMEAELSHLVFVRCTPAQAAKDWKLVQESGAIWQPEKALTRKEKLANLVWTGDSFANGWETLKANFHKTKQEEPAKKKAKGEGEQKDVPAPVVDISGLSAW